MDTSSNPEEGISLQELWHIISKRIYILILVSVLSLGCAFLYLHFSTYEYQTSVTILVDPMKRTSTIGKILSSDFFDSSNDISTEIQLATNITNLQSALSKLDLSSYENKKGLSYENPQALGTLKDKVSVNKFKDTNIVELTVKDPNPQFAMDYANALATSFNDMLSTYGKDTKNAQLEFLQRQIPEVEQQMDEANDKLFDYRVKTGIDFLSNSTASLVNHISYLQMKEKPFELQSVKCDSLEPIPKC